MHTKSPDIGIQLKSSIENQINSALMLIHNRELSQKSIVRELRRNIKNVRSIFKLFRPVISEIDFHTTDEQIGKINRALTIQREAWVNLKTYHYLEGHLPENFCQLTKTMIFNELTDNFNSVYSNKNNAFDKIILNISFQLSKLQEKVNLLLLREYSESMLYLALEKSYTKTSRLYFHSKISLRTDIMHKWKRFNKHFTNQIMFVSLFHETQFDKLTEELDMLTELLGKERDLVILNGHLTKKMQKKIDRKERMMLHQVIDSERRKLQKAAFVMSNSLFAKRINIFKTEEAIAS
jgi:hypothetical protein